MYINFMLSAIVVGVVSGMLWPKKRHSRPAALLVGIAVWLLSAHVARLPRAALPTPNELNIVDVLAVSDSHAFLVEDKSIVQVALSDGSISARYPFQKTVVFTSVAWNGASLLFTYHDGGEGGWAAMRDGKWMVVPHKAKNRGPNPRAYWDAEKRVFVLASFLQAKVVVDKDHSEGVRLVQPIANSTLMPTARRQMVRLCWFAPPVVGLGAQVTDDTVVLTGEKVHRVSVAAVEISVGRSLLDHKNALDSS